MKVYLISRPALDWSALSQFAHDENLPAGVGYAVEPVSDAETLVEMCGRLCYMSFGKGRKTTAQFLDNIIKANHHSVLEHNAFTFIITGVSRSLTHELVRHRHFSYSQLSQRYVDHAEVPSVMPLGIEGTPIELEWRQHQEQSRALYAKIADRLSQEMVTWTTTDRKTARGIARSVLPEATETKIAVTGNARTWREFIQKRMSPHADQEIRNLATEIFLMLKEAAPLLFHDLEAR